MKRKAGRSPQLPATTKKHRSGSDARQTEPDSAPFKIPELLPTSRSSGSAIWDSPTLPSPLFLTNAAIKEHNRRNSYIFTHITETDFQPDLQLSLTVPKRFARTGGPDMSAVRGNPEPPHNISNDHSSHTDAQDSDHDGPMELRPPPLPRKRKSSNAASAKSGTKKTRSSATASTPKTDKSGPYDPNFGAHLSNSYVMPVSTEEEPSNFADWTERIQLACPELSEKAFTVNDHRKFRKDMHTVGLEDNTRQDVFSLIRGRARYQKDFNRSCTNLKPLTLVNTTILQPDYMEGCERNPDDMPLTDILGPYVVVSGAEHAPFMPNLFAEIKGGRGNFEVATLQARYDGACGARGIHKVLNVGKKTEVFDSKAYTVSFTYVGVTLQMYLHWVVESKNATLPLRYEMVEADSWALTNLESCRKGISAFRNAMTYANELREQARCAALSIIHQMPSGEYQALVREAELSKLADKATPSKGDQAMQGMPTDGSQGNNFQYRNDSTNTGPGGRVNLASSGVTRSLPLQDELDPEADVENPVPSPIRPAKSRSHDKTARKLGEAEDKDTGEKNGTRSKISRMARNLKPKMGKK